jgi:flagellar protein FliT
MTSLDQIVAMAALSTRMVEAARVNDWTLLTQLERQQAALRDGLAVRERVQQALSAAERQRKAELIQQILADGEEVLRHVQPAQESVRRLLSTSAMGRSLRQTYSVGPSIGQ